MPHEEGFDHSGSVPPITPTFPESQLRPAALTVARHATSATDCAELLSMLGLTPQDGLTDRKASA